MSILELLFGTPLRTDEQEEQRIGAARGIPVLGLDALSSAAYGPEAARTVLPVIGATASRYLVPITAIILVVFIAVYLSYRQTIEAYPGGGGSYTVASGESRTLPGAARRECPLARRHPQRRSRDLGWRRRGRVGRTGAAPLYPPALSRHSRLPHHCHLRGIRESGLVFLLPTYLFVGTLGVMLIVGLARTFLSHGHPVPVTPLPQRCQPPLLSAPGCSVRAFASGTTAMTGVEAVSNGVPLFRDRRCAPPIARSPRSSGSSSHCSRGSPISASGTASSRPRQTRRATRAPVADHRRRHGTRGVLLRHHGVGRDGSLPLGQHQLRRLPAAAACSRSTATCRCNSPIPADAS